jgi:hypothetical protein
MLLVTNACAIINRLVVVTGEGEVERQRQRRREEEEEGNQKRSIKRERESSVATPEADVVRGMTIPTLGKKYSIPPFFVSWPCARR